MALASPRYSPPGDRERSILRGPVHLALVDCPAIHLTFVHGAAHLATLHGATIHFAFIHGAAHLAALHRAAIHFALVHAAAHLAGRHGTGVQLGGGSVVRGRTAGESPSSYK